MDEQVRVLQIGKTDGEVGDPRREMVSDEVIYGSLQGWM